jgi:hypothetical protein
MSDVVAMSMVGVSTVVCFYTSIVGMYIHSLKITIKEEDGVATQHPSGD